MRALLLAEALLKVVQANVAREARGAVKHHPPQESSMDIENAAATIIPNDQSESVAQTPPTIEHTAQDHVQAHVQEHTETLSTIDARIQALTKLALILNQNSDIKSLICLLLEVPKQNQTQSD
ncbi:MAG TPA: hypothetical protein VIN57_04990 [Magnetovibrio sp.]